MQPAGDLRTTVPFSEYQVDASHMLDVVKAAQTEMYEETARWPCLVYLHSLDHAQLAEYMWNSYGSQLGGTGGKLFGMNVMVIDTVPLGTAQLQLCPRDLSDTEQDPAHWHPATSESGK